MTTNRGQFKPGTSGNPGGRPKVPDELRTALNKNAPEILDKVIQLAKDGNIRACEMVLNRVYPVIAYELDPEAFIVSPIAEALRALREDGRTVGRDH